MNIFLIALVVWAAFSIRISMSDLTDGIGLTNNKNEEMAERQRELLRQEAGDKANSMDKANQIYIDYMNRALDVQGEGMQDQKNSELAALVAQLGLTSTSDLSYRQMLNAVQAQQQPYQMARQGSLQALPILQHMAGAKSYRLPTDVKTVDYTSGSPDYGALFKQIASMLRPGGDTQSDAEAAAEEGVRVNVKTPPAETAPTPTPAAPTATTPTPTPAAPPDWAVGSGGTHYGNSFIGGRGNTPDTPQATGFMSESGEWTEFPPGGEGMVRVPVNNWFDQQKVIQMGGTADGKSGFGMIPSSGLKPGQTAAPAATPTQTTTDPTQTPTDPTGGGPTEDEQFNAMIQEIVDSGVFGDGGPGGDLTTTSTELEEYTPEYDYKESPLYKFKKDEAAKTSRRAQLARGIYGSETGAAIDQHDQSRLDAEEAENQYRRIADIVNIGLGGQATAGALPAAAGQKLAGLYSGLGQDMSTSMNAAARARGGLYGDQSRMISDFGSGLAENTAQIGAARADVYGLPAQVQTQPGNSFLDTAIKAYGLYSGFGAGGFAPKPTSFTNNLNSGFGSTAWGF